MKDATNGRRKFVATAGFAAVAAALGETLIGREVRADDDDRDSNTDKFIRAVQRARLFDLSQLWDENRCRGGAALPLGASRPGGLPAARCLHTECCHSGDVARDPLQCRDTIS